MHPASHIRAFAQRVADSQLWITLALAPLFVFPLPNLTAIALAGLILVGIARRAVLGSFLPPSPMTLPAVVIVGFAVLGTIVAPQPAQSLTRLSSILIGFFLFVAAANHRWSRRQIAGAGAGLIGVGVISALVGTFGGRWEDGAFIFPLPALYDRIPSLIVGLPGAVKPPVELIHPRLVGGTLALLLPMAIAGIVASPSRGYRAWCWAGALGMGGVLLLSQSVSAIAGAIVAAVAICAWRFPSRRKVIVIGFALLTGVALLAALQLAPVQSALQPDGRIGLALRQRLEIWEWSLYALNDVPLTGIGLNALPYAFASLYPEFGFSADIPVPQPLPHAHQLFLHTALDLGLPGLVALVVLLAAFALSWSSALRPPQDAGTRVFLVGTAGGLCAYLAFATIDALVIGSKPLLALWFMLGLCAARAASPGAMEGSTARRWRWAAGLGTLALLLVSAPFLVSRAQLNAGTLAAHRVLYANWTVESDEGPLAANARDWLGSAQGQSVASCHSQVLLSGLQGRKNVLCQAGTRGLPLAGRVLAKLEELGHLAPK